MSQPLVRRLSSVRSVAVLVALTVCGYLGNYLRIPLFFNVDFLFGSLFALIIVYAYGIVPGALAAALIAAHTWILWQHPYAIVIMTMEVVFVGLAMRYKIRNIVLADAIYWLIIGMPLVGLFYHLVMGVSPPSSYLIAFKQAINGIVNALLAAAIISAVEQFTSWLDDFEGRNGFGFRDVLFLAMAALVLVPAVLIMVATARQEMTRVEESVKQRLAITSIAAEQSVQEWLGENMQTLRSLALIAQLSEDSNRRQLTQEAELLRQSDQDFAMIAVLDDAGAVIAMSPPTLPLPYGVDLADVPQAMQERGGGSGAATDAMPPPGSNTTVRDPAVALAVPIAGSGTVVGMLAVERVADLLQRLTADWMIRAVLVDGAGVVIASTDPAVEPMKPFASQVRGDRLPVDRTVYLRLSGVGENTSIMERWQQSEYGTRNAIGGGTEWELILRAPIAPYQDELNDRYRRLLMVMLVLVIATIVVASMLSRMLIGSLETLGKITDRLPEKVIRNERLSWPRSKISEIDTLIGSFKDTTTHLSESFRRIQSANDALLVASQEAEAANRTKSQFLANISHDLRTPLNGILGYAQILRKDLTLDDQTRDAVRIIEKSGNHLLNLINDILDVSRIEANKLTLEIAPFRLDGFLEDIGDIIQLQARTKGLQFAAEADPNLPRAVTGDETRLRQVLLNLLNNAVKFTDEGSVALRVTRSAARMRFTVEDTGIGIPAEQLEEIFSPFKQLDRHVQSDEGTGLGLAIVQRLVAMMGGEVRVQSEVGKGARFWFEIELPEAPVLPEDEHGLRSATAYRGVRRLVLVVDDKWENRSVIVSMLSPLGFTVVEAKDGREGIEKMRAEEPDIVLMDLVMPNLDGFEAIRIIREDETLRNTRVIAVSASVARSIRDECVRVGFDDFLPKPFRESDLLEQLRRLLGIEWLYAESAPVEQDGGQPLRKPPPEMLDSIQRAVESGDIRAVVAEAQRLGAEESTYARFFAKVVQLAREFEISRLRGLIEQCLGCEDE